MFFIYLDRNQGKIYISILKIYINISSRDGRIGQIITIVRLERGQDSKERKLMSESLKHRHNCQSFQQLALFYASGVICMNVGSLNTQTQTLL